MFYSLRNPTLMIKKWFISPSRIYFDVILIFLQLLKIEYIDRKLCDFFKGIVFHSMNYRLQHNIHRADMINMLMEASDAHKWNDIELSAQCLLFFFAGFETMATVMSFTAHELMENPEIQEKLYEEI